MRQVSEIKELEINLRAQQFKNPSSLAKKFYMAGAYLLPLFSLAALLYAPSWTTLFYFVLFSMNAGLYYGIATGRDPYQYIIGKSYLKVNTELLETKSSFKKPVTIHWNEAQALEIKLFSADTSLKTGEKLSTNLEELSDDNLKLVKQHLQKIKELYQL